VVIFDEAQMLPLPFLRPCVAAIAELVKHYGVTAVLCTATQPSLNGLFHEFAPDITLHEICPDVTNLTSFFRRVRYVSEGVLSLEEIASRLTEQKQALCVVNLRANARALFLMLPEEGRFHLSTRMTPNDRTRTLGKIRQRLKNGEVCRVVSTSLIEAGVDVDFPTVWREMAGLDSIIQAAGRCNREGKRSLENSFVHVFSLMNGVPKMIQQNAIAAATAMEGQENIDTAPVIKNYFDELLRMKGGGVDAKDVMDTCQKMNLRTTADIFHLIDEDTMPIYIPTDDNADDLARLRWGEPSRGLLRRLNQSAVNVYRHEWRALREAGRLEDLTGGFGILKDIAAYDEECGLDVNVGPGQDYWL